MPKCKLSETDKQDISNAMRGLMGSVAKIEAQRLAEFYAVHVTRIYEVSRQHRPERKKRSDCGRRKIDLLGNSATKGIAEFVSNQKVSPELAALTVQANPDLFGEVPEISLGTLRRYLREHGISRLQQTGNVTAYRSFTADFPGQIFQFDISGVKQRWVDVKTRTIHKVDVLEVSKNHPNSKRNRVPLWKFSMIDDNSRKKFVRFVACQKPNTVHVIEFWKEAFLKLGLPFYLYSDNDSIIVNKRTLRGASFLNETFRDSGGFELIQHLPGRPQATGKVERMHQSIEEYEKLIGVKTAFGGKLTLERLNSFADFITEHQDSRIHRVTGVAPNVAFRKTTNPKRLIDPALFDAAFKARDLTLRVHGDVTISVDGVKYQLSRRDSDPFVHLAVTRQKINVYWIDDDDFFACVTPEGDQFIVQKLVAKADAVGEYKTLPESIGEKTKKVLKESQKERVAAIKSERASSIIVPGIDTEIPELPRDEKILDFPQRVETGDVDRLHELTYQLANDAPEYSRRIDLLDALDLLQSEGLAPAEPCSELTEFKAWLRTVFNGRELITEADLMSAWNAGFPARIPAKIAAVK